MGAADLVPGISGGTIAFIMGFYQDLLNSLKTFKWSSLKLLATFQFRTFLQQVSWRFLLTLISGISFSFILLAGVLHWVLQHEIYRVYLYSGFLGLILASFILCMRELKRWTLLEAMGLLVGALSAYALTGSTLTVEEQGPYAIKMEYPSDQPLYNYDSNQGLLIYLSKGTLSIMLAKNVIQADTSIYNLEGEVVGLAKDFTVLFKSSYIDFWLIFCGAIAICALLLPGISGSYLLTLLGVYPQAIAALADLVGNIKYGFIDWDAAVLLFNLLIGIVLGALFFSRIASWLLKKYPDISLAVLSGFMIGALRSVWPFWSYTYTLVPIKLSKGPQLLPLEPIMPSFGSWSFVLAILAAIIGFALVFFIELAAKEKKDRTPSPETT
jgi:putative membrane protein